MLTKFGATLASALFVFAAASAHAQNVDAGRVIAEQWCSSCHLVDHQQNRVPNDAIPSFRAVANMKSTTMISLSVFLQTPHQPMPNFMLSRREIADVSAYILSLRTADSEKH